MTAVEGTATRLGWSLGQAVRALVALLLAGGLLGAALGSARSADLAAFTADLDHGRVSEVVITDGNPYRPAALQRGDTGSVLRWKVVGGGWRTTALGDVSSWPVSTVDTVRQQARAAGVPVSDSHPRTAPRLIELARIAELLLVLVLIGAPQPRRATKWAWFWLMLVPGGLTQLAWLALEAPWSARANRRPEPLAHRHQPDDRRLTGGVALVVSIGLGTALSLLGALVAGWLSS